MLPATASAWDGTVNDTISQIDVTDGDQLGFRIYFPNSTACGNAHNWAYLNRGDSNYQAYVAAALMAKATGTPVTVYSNVDANGYCHVRFLTLR
ncbi:hypothetical protein GCM10011487_67140 [Steroidobacter agaridevorans]|uniref:Uncharacterized protein n=1 Tax=Steroidobacter agaridevorans TaxID=2695856 RepID=A0A829YMN2_9GAMM|nr:hypothetical protein [Steroidobacter agaridevorans]GFE84714.1 hypothetical protein GCM10011487_67140 [Steroidobacter agaridevorans]